MMRRLAFVLALAGCASVPAAAPSLGAALSCSADRVLICPPFGCTAALPGEIHPSSVAVDIPAHGDDGMACEGGRCTPAKVMPTMTRALGWTADLYSGPDYLDRRGEIEVEADRGSFHWRRQETGALYVWRGLCHPA